MGVKILQILNILKAKKICLVLNEFRQILTYSQRFSSRYIRNIDPLPNRYGGKTNVTILPGSGIGPEIMESTIKVLTAAEAPLTYEILNLSADEENISEFENILHSIRRNKISLKGSVEINSKDPSVSSRNVHLRNNLDLYVYLVFCKTYPGLANKFGEIDTTVIRQNTEGEYLMLEHELSPTTVESLKIITRYNSERLAEFAFNYALANKKNEITLVHSADIHVYTEGVFVEAAKNISKKYPKIKLNIVEVGVAVTELESNPKLFEIILATNLNGSIVSNILNGMVGGPGLSAGMNFSDDGIAIFEPAARNKASSIVGQGIANPVAMITAGINLLNYLGYRKTAETIQKSVIKTLVDDKVHTRDLGGNATTKEITDNIISHITEQLKHKTEQKHDHLRHYRWKSYCLVPESKPN